MGWGDNEYDSMFRGWIMVLYNFEYAGRYLNANSNVERVTALN